jgi:hypothetical protein
MRIKNQKDFWAGVLFTVLGLFFAGLGSQYTFGTADNMGPGYFPTSLGVITTLIGLYVATSALSPTAKEEKVDAFRLRQALLIIGPVVLFAVLLKPLGLILALFILILTSSLASHEFTWKGALIAAVTLICISLAVFVWALSQQFQLWPAFIGN